MTYETPEAAASIDLARPGSAPRDLFESEVGTKTIAQQHTELPPHQRAQQAIERVLEAGHVCKLSYSAGKDSGACANLMFNAALTVLRKGLKCPLLVVSHSDTGIESPVVRAIADGELAKMRAFAEKHGIPLEIHIGRPTLSASFATRVIGGRALPSFPQSSRDCSVDFKVLPLQRITARLNKTLESGAPAIVTLIGTRSEESAARKANTAARKETAHEIWYSVTGEARLSPILDWQSTDVWEYLGECAAGLHESFSDFQEVQSFYADAGGSSCVIVADMKSVGQSKACGARSGCYLCCATSADHSVENMIAQDPGKYPYLVPLLQLRDYIAATQWDWSKRNFICRTISPEGRIKVGADQYSPQMVEDLLYYTLAAQDLANELGAPALVRAVGIKELIAIDFFWSLRAWHPPFHALAIYFDHCAGNRRYAPKVERPCRPSPAPVIGEIDVGTDWDNNVSELFPSGLRHPLWELFSDSCGPQLRANKAGKIFLDLEETPEFEVDEASGFDYLDFIAPEKIAMYHKHETLDWTVGAMDYLQYGTVSLATGQSSAIDSMIRRSQWLQRHGLHGHQTAETLRSRCCSLVASQSQLFA